MEVKVLYSAKSLVHYFTADVAFVFQCAVLRDSRQFSLASEVRSFWHALDLLCAVFWRLGHVGSKIDQSGMCSDTNAGRLGLLELRPDCGHCCALRQPDG